tara:strand:- start:107863 stop:108090 length:228 start_codon:yes stop_codon:yes gene_type:complete
LFKLANKRQELRQHLAGPFSVCHAQGQKTIKRRLRDPVNQGLREAFRSVVTRQWSLNGAQENVIGITEDEFRGKA